MDFSLSERDKMLQSAAREFAQKSVLPRSAEIDRTAEFPVDLAEQMRTLGFYGLSFSVELGGSGAGCLGLTLVTEQICQASMAVGVILALCASVGDELLHHGTEEQKQEYLLPLVRGEALPFWAFTESSTGSDPKAIQTIAKPNDDGYCISGEKLFISIVPAAKWGVVFAKDEVARVSAFIVHTSASGFVQGSLHDVMGARGMGSSTIYLNDVKVPGTALLGSKGRGYQILLEGVGLERLAVAIGCLGVGQQAVDLSVGYAKQRLAYGEPIGNLPTIQWLLAEMQCRLQASRWMTYRTAFLRDQGEPIIVESAEAKLFCSQAVVDIARMALEVHGAYGTERTLPVERLYRDAKMTEIIVGVSEIQRVLIASSLLK
ncbi:MAG: acyl-CoA dehydrogenase family protein [Chloroflexota bacterium]|nr:acyl-CoA dehydrogenase family protein [Chloroflexota bacterium]